MSVREAVSVSDSGRSRSYNEDALLCRDDAPVYAVADGMGGAGVGDVAADVAVEVISEAADELSRLLDQVEIDRSSAGRLSLGHRIEQLFLQASDQIRQEALRTRSRRMAASLLAAVVGRSAAYIAHVGNCRAYLFRRGELTVLTEDHSVAVARQRHGRAEGDEPGSDRFRLYQALGANAALDVETAEVPLAEEDVLLLCTDGLTRAVDDAQIARLMRLPTLDDIAAALVAAANEAGGEDNASVVLVRIGAVANQAQVEEVSALLRQVFLFRTLSPAERFTLAPYLEERLLQPGEVLVREGEAGDAFYVLIDGMIQLTAGRTHLLDLGPGDTLGELALTRPIRRAVTATAFEPSRVYSLSRERFQELMQRRPHLGSRLAMSLLDTVGDRLREMTGRVDALTEEIAEMRKRLELVERAARGELRLR